MTTINLYAKTKKDASVVIDFVFEMGLEIIKPKKNNSVRVPVDLDNAIKEAEYIRQWFNDINMPVEVSIEI